MPKIPGWEWYEQYLFGGGSPNAAYSLSVVLVPGENTVTLPHAPQIVALSEPLPYTISGTTLTITASTAQTITIRAIL